MSLEMTYLAMYGVVLVLIILVQVLISASQDGLLTLLGNRESLSSVGVAERAEKTVQNCGGHGLSCTSCTDVDFSKFIHAWNNLCNPTISHCTHRVCNLLSFGDNIVEDGDLDSRVLSNHLSLPEFALI